jgi:hypothetical protein
VSCEFTARWFASFGGIVQRLSLKSFGLRLKRLTAGRMENLLSEQLRPVLVVVLGGL